jgi:hypothetical protein
MLIPALMAGAEKTARIIPQRAQRGRAGTGQPAPRAALESHPDDRPCRKPRRVAIHGDTGSP